MFFTLIFAVLLLKYKYYANDEFSFTITTNQTRFFCRRRWKSNDLKVIALCMFPRWWSPASWILSKCYILTNLSKNTLPMLLYCQIWWQSVERFKSYKTLFNYKMASAAILDFVKILHLIKFSKSASAMVISRQVWWQSVERFKSYSTLFIYKMASAILDFVKILCLTTLSWRMLLPLLSRQIWWQSLNGSKVITLFLFPKWRSPPSWILSKCYIWLICQKIRYRRYYPVKYGDNRLNGSKVNFYSTFLFSRWRQPPSWISLKCYIWLNFQIVRHRWCFPVKYGDNR